LRVHRRCEKPMFDISNAIAYDGLMVYGTDKEPFQGAPYRDYPLSCWVDVSGASEGKWVPAQGDVLLKILRRMRGEFGISLEHIYVLSPFRDVVSGCKGFVRPELREDGVPEPKVSDFIENHIATVHKMQGKEAKVVVFVLGTDPSRAKKARDWAARSVNLLNVAVSRAQRRLFIIGDFMEWKGEHYFQVFDDPSLFPRRPLPRQM
jgi:AAA domain